MFHVEHLEPLRDGMKAAGLMLRPESMAQFIEYGNLLLGWNQKMNLISRHDEGRIVTRHFLESAGLVTMFDFPLQAKVMDLGTGAGFPGIPVKLVRPDIQMLLVESRQKKVQFLKAVIGQLRVKGLEVICARAEDLGGKGDPVDVVISRSVADLLTLFQWSRALLKSPGGCLVAIKGSRVEEEIKRFVSAAGEYGIRSCRSRPYDPFPSIMPLTHQTLVVIELE